ncbi:MAG: response regulator [Nitrospirae bacterium]|nr:response regulator [Nitrospirota bacterium]
MKKKNAKNISGRRHSEQKLRHTQRLEILGSLTSCVVHDFNNVLTAIMGYGHLLQMKMREDGTYRHNIEQILASAEKAANLTQSLLAFSKKKVKNPRPIELNGLIRETEKFLSRVINENVELNMKLANDNLTVMADSNQIEQVLINLCTNARDAMPEGGFLTIETSPIKLGAEFIKRHCYGKRGDYALISVTDNGIGMNEDIRKKIFKPFFTTKKDGKGTGLGLSIAYRIIKQHSGYVNVYSESGRGTTFKIYLPVTASEVEEKKSEEFITPVGGTETILLAEDDIDVREFTKAVLEEFGYTVIKAVNGEDAIIKFKENKDKIHLLLLDIIMPKKNGREVYEEIRKIRPDVKVLFASGYPSDFIHKKEICEQGLDFISKPTPPQELLKKLRAVLDKNINNEKRIEKSSLRLQ